jgi:hypothetical protein
MTMVDLQVMGVRGKYGKWLTGRTSTALATTMWE